MTNVFVTDNLNTSCLHSYLCRELPEIKPIVAGPDFLDQVRSAKPECILFDITTLGTDQQIKDILGGIEKSRAKVIFFSTSYVYGTGVGFTEKDRIKPDNRDAIFKSYVELKIRELFDNFVIIRVSKLYGPRLGEARSYVDYVIDCAKSESRILAVRDIRFNPLFITDLTDTLKILVKDPKRRKEVYNLGGPDMVSHIDIAMLTLSTFGLSGKILPVTSLDISLSLGNEGVSTINSMSCAKIYKHFNPKKRTTIEEGIKKIYGEYKVSKESELKKGAAEETCRKERAVGSTLKDTGKRAGKEARASKETKVG